MSDRLPALLIDARHILGLSQGGLGELLGASRRTGQRWEGGGAVPSAAQLHELARCLHATNPELAAAVAAEGNTTLVELGILSPPPPVAPAPPPSPAAPPPSPDDIVDSVVCAAADAIDVTPRTIRPAVLAAFTRARKIGLSVEAVEKALVGVRSPGSKGKTG